jgi:hypothetical protein
MRHFFQKAVPHARLPIFDQLSNSNKKGEAPLFIEPSGFHLWHNL